jgi:geranylgeranyl diphosphate synthase type II
MKIEQYLSKLKKRIDYTLDGWLPKDNNIISKAMRYSVFSGGKRLRPILTISSAQLVGGKVEDALSTACAIELIHNFALIHDDLPSMDDDDYRRNKPTCHKIFGEAIAILAGDALLNQAFELVSEDTHISSTLAIKILKELCQGIGLNGMIGGQALEMWYRKEKRKVNLSNLIQIYNRKTAALICSAIRVGAIIG